MGNRCELIWRWGGWVSVGAREPCADRTGTGWAGLRWTGRQGGRDGAERGCGKQHCTRTHPPGGKGRRSDVRGDYLAPAPTGPGRAHPPTAGGCSETRRARLRLRLRLQLRLTTD
ncbi:hypothetical protein CALCODRAFT_345352 [Calocera cornea HHB12733]|uniref:Uncharacterized protein n=1 Tax=Calocera cornea HHB12733 TaxID=1353952 RepID=A0A165EV01_9BASI|nr:hypothetical protein CALCODRAFT_345352 [Calocera cornea HHB12733]